MSTRLQQRLSFFLDYKITGQKEIQEVTEELSELEKAQLAGTASIESLAKDKVALDRAIASNKKSMEGLTIDQRRVINNYEVLQESVDIASTQFEQLRYEYESGRITSEQYSNGLNRIQTEMESWNNQSKQSIQVLRRVNAQQQQLDTQTKIGTRNTYHAQRGVMSFTNVMNQLAGSGVITNSALASLIGNVNLLNSRVDQSIPAWRVFLNFLKGPAGFAILVAAVIPVLVKLNKELGLVQTSLYDTKEAGEAAASMLKDIRESWSKAFEDETQQESPVEKLRRDLEAIDVQIQALGADRTVGEKVTDWAARQTLWLGTLYEQVTGQSRGALQASTELETRSTLYNSLMAERKNILGELTQAERLYNNEAISGQDKQAKAEKERRRTQEYYISTIIPAQLALEAQASEQRITLLQREALTFERINKERNERLKVIKLNEEAEIDSLSRQLQKKEISQESYEQRLVQIQREYTNQRLEISNWEFEQQRELRQQFYALDATDLSNSMRSSELRISLLQREALSMERIRNEKSQRLSQIEAQEQAQLTTLKRNLEDGLISREVYDRQLKQIQEQFTNDRIALSYWEFDQIRQLKNRMLQLDEMDRQLNAREVDWQISQLERMALTYSNIASIRKVRLQQQADQEKNAKDELDRLLAEGQINAEEHERRLTQIHREGVLERKQIDQDANDDAKYLTDQRIQFAENMANALQGIGAVIYGSNEKNAKKAFETDKALSLASATVFGSLAFIRALATNPWEAAGVAVTTAANIAKIMATKFKGRASGPETTRSEQFQYGFRGISGETESGTAPVFAPQFTMPSEFKLVDSNGQMLATLQRSQDKEGITPYMPVPQ